MGESAPADLSSRVREEFPDTTIVAVIPARLGSEEIHAKVLEDLGGKPVIQHVYERVLESGLFSEVILAVDHQKIVDAVEKFGGRPVLTSKDHVCGSDRCAEATRDIEADVVVNVQADEPFLNPKMLPEVVYPLLEDRSLDVSTLCVEFPDVDAANFPFDVKVVRSAKSSLALYFSRAPIPYPRTPGILPHYHHVGVYAFKYESLQKFAELGPSPLELTEGLEQLRALEHGFRIKVVETGQEYAHVAIDTQRDLDRARELLRNG
ncbi:MAG: 3-deoxy-manno-octulosonate cytidylyltransferase [Promethearchaeota archaeon]